MSVFEPRVDRTSRVLPAAAATVYAAFLDQASMEVWLPPEGMVGSFSRFEPWVGGVCTLELTYLKPESRYAKTTESTDVSEFEFVELVENSRVSHKGEFESDDPAFAGVMTMVWELEEFPGGTMVTVSAYDVPSGIRQEDHIEGMTSSLENLGRFVAPPAE